MWPHRHPGPGEISCGHRYVNFFGCHYFDGIFNTSSNILDLELRVVIFDYFSKRKPFAYQFEDALHRNPSAGYAGLPEMNVGINLKPISDFSHLFTYLNCPLLATSPQMPGRRAGSQTRCSVRLRLRFYPLPTAQYSNRTTSAAPAARRGWGCAWRSSARRPALPRWPATRRTGCPPGPRRFGRSPAAGHR
jgi:hypothetical protein